MKGKKKKPRSADTTPATSADDLVTTTIRLQNGLFAKAKERARMMSLSLSGYVAQAVYRDLMHAPVPAGQLMPSMPVVADVEPARRPRNLTKHGRGITIQAGDSGSDQDIFLSWEDVLEYDEAYGRYPDLNGDPVRLAKKLNWEIERALAADVAFQTPQYRAFLKDYESHAAQT